MTTLQRVFCTFFGFIMVLIPWLIASHNSLIGDDLVIESNFLPAENKSQSIEIKEWTRENYSKYDSAKFHLVITKTAEEYQELAKKYDLLKSYNNFSENWLVVAFHGKRNDGYNVESDSFIYDVKNVKAVLKNDILTINAEVGDNFNALDPRNSYVKVSSLVVIYKMPISALPPKLKNIFLNLERKNYQTIVIE